MTITHSDVTLFYRGGRGRGEIRELDVFADVTVVRACALKPGYLGAVPALLFVSCGILHPPLHPPKPQFLLLSNRGNNTFYYVKFLRC